MNDSLYSKQSHDYALCKLHQLLLAHIIHYIFFTVEKVFKDLLSPI